MRLEIRHTDVFDWNMKAIERGDIRFIINQGGSRSSKTYSLCQLMIVWCLLNENKVVSIIRKTFPTLRGSVMKDFFEVMKDLGVYDAKRHQKTTHEYFFNNGSVVEFFSADDEQKLRGRKRDVLWANEANELSFNEFNQLNMRTTEKLFFDFNPSDNEHWLYDLMERENSELIKSTYKNNPFLSTDQLKEIEYLISVDENYYKIYALGEKPIPMTRIYQHFKLYKENIEGGNVHWGLDFGYNHPTVLVKVIEIDEVYYCEEVIYERGLTVEDLITRFRECGVDKKNMIWADGSRPEIIESLRRAGWNVKAADKEVKAGIDFVKSKIIMLRDTSVNLWKEYRMYNWKVNGERILDEPVKEWDDGMDALRYAIYSGRKRGYNKKFSSFYTFKD